MRNERRETKCCGGFREMLQECLPMFLLLLFLVLVGLAVINIVFGGIWLGDPPPRHISASTASSDSHIVNLHATSPSDVLDVQQTTTFQKVIDFYFVVAQNLTASNATIYTIILTNQTSGGTYDLDGAIESIIDQQDSLDNVLGMPELLTFLENYYNQTMSLMRRRRALQRGPDVVTFLYDTQNNITALQQSLAAVNQSLYANANYAFYPALSTVVPMNPANALVNLSASGAFAQQVGTSISGNQVSVGKAGLYSITYNVAIAQPASALQQTVSLLVGSSTISSSSVNWAGAATGTSSVSQTVIVTLATTDLVKLVVSASATGSTVNAVGSILSVYNIS